MENPINHTNGKSTLISHPPTMTHTEHHRSSTSVEPAGYSRLLDLVRDTVDLEIRLKAARSELDQVMKDVGAGELPEVLLALLRPQHAAPVIPPAPEPKLLAPGPKKAQPRPAQNMGGSLKAQVMGAMADGAERRSNVIIETLRSKSPTSVYTVLTQLVQEGHLIKTKFAHYRLKMRRR